MKMQASLKDKSRIIWRGLDRWDAVEFLFACSVIILASVSALVSLSAEDQKDLKKLLLPVFSAIFGVGVLVLQLRRKKVEAEKQIKEEQNKVSEEQRIELLRRRCVVAILISLREQYFANCEQTEKHQHRVTLFQLDKHDPANMRLRIYARAAEVAEQSDTSFAVDGTHKKRCEGIAGLIWHMDCTQTVILPEWPTDEQNTAGRYEYASLGNLTVEQAERLKIKSRGITGTAVRVHGDRWGVLVLDSQNPDHIKRKGAMVEGFAILLGKVATEFTT